MYLTRKPGVQGRSLLSCNLSDLRDSSYGGSEHNACKGPGAGLCLVCRGNSEEAHLAGAERARGRERGGDGAGRAGPCGLVGRTWGFIQGALASPGRAVSSRGPSHLPRGSLCPSGSTARCLPRRVPGAGVGFGGHAVSPAPGPRRPAAAHSAHI